MRLLSFTVGLTLIGMFVKGFDYWRTYQSHLSVAEMLDQHGVSYGRTVDSHTPLLPEFLREYSTRVAYIGDTTSLPNLDTSRRNMTADELSVIQSCAEDRLRTLGFLALKGTNVTDGVLAGILDNLNVSILDLDCTSITSEGFLSLTNYSSLERIELYAPENTFSSNVFIIMSNSGVNVSFTSISNLPEDTFLASEVIE